MTQFTVQAPDGQHIKVQGPEGASDADAIAFAKQNWEPNMQPLTDEPLAPLTQVAANYRPGHPQFGVDIPSEEDKVPRATDYTRQIAPPLPGGGAQPRAPARGPLSDEAIDAALRANPGASIFDVAQVPQAAPPPPRPSTRPPMGRSETGTFMGTQNALQAFGQFIKPHYSEGDFVNQYFAGMATRGMELTHVADKTYVKEIRFDGDLQTPQGTAIGSISRVLYPSEGRAYHSYLRLDKTGVGWARQLLANQMEVYKTTGISKVDLGANIDVGSYAWAKYGWLPKTPGDWTDLARTLSIKLIRLKRSLQPGVPEMVNQLLQSPDPRTIWKISDLTAPVVKDLTLGKALLMNESWDGRLDLTNPEQMDRFNGYIAKAR